jgi:LmeA-like phospholipid-binding
MVDRSQGTEVDVYPNQPRSQGGWPDQPPQYSERPGEDEAGSGSAPYGSGAPGTQRQGGRPLRPRRRRGRGWIALLVVLVVLAVLFVIGDQVAKAYAQNTIASKIQSSSGMSAKPSVTIEGFPFLTQVAAHDVRVIDLSANNVPAGKFDISSVKAKATGVHLNSSFSGATIDQINGTALITFASLEQGLGVQGVATISADPADGPNAVKLSAGAIGSVTGKVEQTAPDQVMIQMGSLSGLASLLNGAVPVQTQTITIPKLPMGLVVHSVSVTSQGIVATASAQHTTLTQ